MGGQAEVLLQLRRALRRAGLDLVRYAPEAVAEVRLVRLWSRLGIERVLDVGANEGQFGRFVREAGYRGQLISYEPVAAAFARLQRSARGHPNWSVVQAALGAEAGRRRINVSANDQISSFLPILDSEAHTIPQSAAQAAETVQVVTLAEVLAGSTVEVLRRTALKLDVQGVEREVLAGGGALTAELGCIYTEMTLQPFYRGEPGFREMFDHLSGLGFRCAGLTPGYTDPQSFEMRQVDGVFVRA